MVTINTILAEALDYIATSLEASVAAGTEFNTAVQKILEEIITVHGAAVFNGDGYSDDWQIEAKARGLPNLKTTIDALPELIKPEAMDLFEKYEVFNHHEMHSRYEIGLEQYFMSVSVEARLSLELGSTVILPAAIRFQTELATNVTALAGAGITADKTLLETVSGKISELTAGLATLKAAIESAPHGDGLAEATYAKDKYLPAMDTVRAAADALESLVADDLWPLPTYQEMLYIL
jgi:glutamine synthetase